MLEPGSQNSSLQNCDKIHFCGESHPVYDIVMPVLADPYSTALYHFPTTAAIKATATLYSFHVPGTVPGVVQESNFPNNSLEEDTITLTLILYRETAAQLLWTTWPLSHSY